MKHPRVVASLLVLLSANNYADTISPTVTRVYVQENGKPVNAPVLFAMSCFGIYSRPGQEVPKEYTPQEVFSFSATCPSYGCTIYEHYYVNYRIIDYCDLSGTAGDLSFSIPRFSTTPTPSCQPIDQGWDIHEDGRFYRTNPEYDRCRETSLAQADERCEHLTQHSDTFKQSLTCYEKEQKNISRCNKYRTEVPVSSFPRDPRGNLLMRECTLRFDIGQSLAPAD